METPRIFIIANLSMRKLGFSSVLIMRLFLIHASIQSRHFMYIIISTDEDPSLRIESFVMMNLRGVPTKLN